LRNKSEYKKYERKRSTPIFSINNTINMIPLYAFVFLMAIEINAGISSQTNEKEK
jgi:hypothetical protein